MAWNTPWLISDQRRGQGRLGERDLRFGFQDFEEDKDQSQAMHVLDL